MMAKKKKVWVVVDWSNSDVLVAFTKKPTKKMLEKYFGIDPKDFEYGDSPLEDMDVTSVTVET
jgi:hypothetical protein